MPSARNLWQTKVDESTERTMKFLATPFLRHFRESFRELRRKQRRGEMFSLESILAPVVFSFKRNSTFVFSSSMIVFYTRTFALFFRSFSCFAVLYSDRCPIELYKERKLRLRGKRENTNGGRDHRTETRRARPAAIPRYTNLLAKLAKLPQGFENFKMANIRIPD